MLVVTRLRAPSPDPADGSELRAGLLHALGILADRPSQIGMLAQSPTGDGTVVRFEDVRFSTDRLHGVRDGS